MNAETANLIERPYQEIVDDILTAIVGGKVNEPIIFDVKSILYPLAEPARAIRGITGTIEEANSPGGVLRYTFQNQIDFDFSADKNAVVWQEGGKKPKDETKFYVDYFLTTVKSPLSDINVGSVTRTLGEAIGREIATVYQQINLAYKSGFIDTAEGKALDFVVSILGVTRKTKEYAVGLETFFRAAPGPGNLGQGNITIPQGTEVSTAKGDVIFQTTEPRTLQRGQARIDIPIRAGDKFKGEKGKQDAGKINSLLQVIEGIDRVNNFEATFLAAEDETDEELRLRAKAVLQSLGKGTIAALERTAAESRAKVLKTVDPNSTEAPTELGKVLMSVEVEAARFGSLIVALHDVRAAGVQLTVTANVIFVTPKIIATITPGLTGEGKAKVANETIAAVQKYFEGLKANEQADGSAILNAIKKVDDVQTSEAVKPTIVDVKTSRSETSRADASPLVEALITALSDVNTANTGALRNIVETVVEAESRAIVPREGRIPDRSLVQAVDNRGTSTGGRAEDGDILTGKFAIVPPPGFSLVLEMQPTDIILR